MWRHWRIDTSRICLSAHKTIEAGNENRLFIMDYIARLDFKLLFCVHSSKFGKCLLGTNHRIKISNRRATQQKYAVLLTKRRSSQPASTACLLARKCHWLAMKMAANMRNATCARTESSKLPTQVALLYGSLFCGIQTVIGLPVLVPFLTRHLWMFVRHHSA